MNDMQKPDRIYVAVTPSGAARCKWCGTAESSNRHSTKVGIYCSDECEAAADALSLLSVFLLWQTITVFAVVLSLMPNVKQSGPPELMELLLQGSCLWLLYGSWKGWQLRRAIPKNSRRNNTTLDLVMLRAAATKVKCPLWNASIDTRKIGHDMAYRCDYRGTSGRVELVKRLY